MTYSIPPSAHKPSPTDQELDLEIASLQNQCKSLQKFHQDQDEICENYKKQIAKMKQNLSRVKASYEAVLLQNSVE